MKKYLPVLALLAACAATDPIPTKNVSDVIIGGKGMEKLPELPAIQASGKLTGGPVKLVLVDIDNSVEIEAGGYDNPVPGLRNGFKEAIQKMGFEVFAYNGTYRNDPKLMWLLLASDTAQRHRESKQVTVADAILHVDWREQRLTGPIGRLGTLIIGGDAELQIRACLWGPDGSLVWKGEFKRPIDRAGVLTGATLTNQMNTPAKRTGLVLAREAMKGVEPILKAASRE